MIEPRDLRTLAEVVRAGYAITGVVTQDEYTHDVIAVDGARWLVFDTT